MMFLNSSLSALKAAVLNQNIVSNNIANASTPGFKEKSARQAEVKGGGVKTTHISENFQQGSFIFTGDKLHIAVDGGYTRLKSVQGREYFSRGGSFFKDASGNLVNSNGVKLQPEINLKENEDIIFSSGGGYLITDKEGGIVKEGRLQIYSFQNEGGLLNEGGGLYSKTQNSGLPVKSNFNLTQGALESSNVDLAGQMTEMIVNKSSLKLQVSVIRIKDEMIEDIIDIRK